MAAIAGEVYAINLVFHNAYGPDKDWFYDMAQSGGGCVMDLGIHLLDLAHWITGDGAFHAHAVALTGSPTANVRSPPSVTSTRTWSPAAKSPWNRSIRRATSARDAA